MKQVYLKSKSLLLLLVMLCVSMSAFADGTVNIDGVYYQLNNGWSYGYYDSNNVWKSTPYYNKAAFVVSEPGVDIWQSVCLKHK